MRRRMASASTRFPPSSRRLPRRCEPPAGSWRRRRRASCRPPAAAIPASAAATGVLRRAGRPGRRHPTKGSPPPLPGSTRPPTRRGWRDCAATKHDGPSRRCFAHPRAPRRDERRHRRAATGCAGVAPAPRARVRAASPARRGTRARGRPLERGRARRPRRPTLVARGAPEGVGRAGIAARARRSSAAAFVVSHGAPRARARASGIAPRTLRAPPDPSPSTSPSSRSSSCSSRIPPVRSPRAGAIRIGSPR